MPMVQRFFWSFLLSILFASGLAFSATKAHAKSSKPPKLSEIFKPFKKAGMTQVDIEKTVTSELLGKKTTYVGKVFLASGLIRWENETPEKTLVVYDGKYVWSVQYASEDFPGPPTVGRAKLDKKNKQQLLLTNLLMGNDIDKLFSVDSTKKDEQFEYAIQPKDSELQIKNLLIKVDPSSKEIKTISYVDEVGNKTEIQFKNINFETKKKSTMFKYEPPKDAKVIDL